VPTATLSKPLAEPGLRNEPISPLVLARHTAGPVHEYEELGVGHLLHIARALAPRASHWPGRWRPRRRDWELLATSSNYEAWVIAWPPGGCIEYHDHGHSAGAVLVVEGQLRETAVLEDSAGDSHFTTKAVRAGEAITFGASYVHCLVNVERAPAVSVHVYSPRLTSMTHFDVVDGRLQPSHTDQYGAALSVV
jgi:quercetin dioxygenase-like cupin family protein